uniref:Uncharacterized protein n=1 Tax=Rhizophora mucronata TaxID=61149 RepID=A0A2P2QGB2_RHIMU
MWCRKLLYQWSCFAQNAERR